MNKEPILACLSFVAIFLLTIFVGTAILVGAADFDPKPAAVVMLLPASLLGLGGAVFTPTRRFFGAWWFFGW